MLFGNASDAPTPPRSALSSVTGDWTVTPPSFRTPPRHTKARDAPPTPQPVMRAAPFPFLAWIPCFAAKGPVSITALRAPVSMPKRPGIPS